MKRLIIFFSLGLITLLSCSKDVFHKELNYKNHKLTKSEKEFFNIHKSIGLVSRSDRSFRITPEVIKVHQHLLEENSRKSFAEGINDKVGTPLWNHAYTFKTGTTDFYVLVPLFNAHLNKINGYLSGMESQNLITMNGMTRSELVGNLNINSAIKKSTLTILAKQEKLLTGNVSSEIDSCLCILSEIIRDNGITFDGSEILNNGDEPCEPTLKEICIDQNGGYHWFGGMGSIPIHLDHDQDGIINSEDQDWIELQGRFNLTQEDFTALVLD